MTKQAIIQDQTSQICDAQKQSEGDLPSLFDYHCDLSDALTAVTIREGLTVLQITVSKRKTVLLGLYFQAVKPFLIEVRHQLLDDALALFDLRSDYGLLGLNQRLIALERREADP